MMHRIAETVIALALAGAAIAPQAAHAESILRTRPADASDLQKFLPPVPDVPWLAAGSRVAAKDTLPQAGSASAWMLTPQPAREWPLASQPAALRTSHRR